MHGQQNIKKKKSWQFILMTYGYELSVTDTSKSNKPKMFGYNLKPKTATLSC